MGTQGVQILATLILGYLLGSIPFGLILTRLFGAGDIRAIGSGNIGATNVLRTGRKGLAAATLIGDALKGTLAVLIASRIGEGNALIAGFAVVIGHIFPVWLGFKGGKGVATFLGVLIGLAWPVAIGFAVVWLAVAALFRFSSLAALVATLATPIAFVVLGQRPQAILFVVLAAIVWWKHTPNIVRLRAGTEGRIGDKG
ncbi:glycerol-3-phosphate acyltransferase PlsY [Kaistia soli DSM 19436]|uniref:Glycerol-3-phosphate acyltransferase n=1 Tax=Kaistia soli DSM 19436 TaxID=1122133 RepID=A0A1M5MKC1_9HYPH|nr:glycerol-3-phosphate 1-O-acyltransferase PlsY [Kaistia soli]SHG77637.1 glycerol-3-phosphate acyltransferase PlsY [Kaistia soli DSM 19436]